VFAPVIWNARIIGDKFAVLYGSLGELCGCSLPDNSLSCSISPEVKNPETGVQPANGVPPTSPGIFPRLRRQRIVDPSRPAVFLKCPQNRYLVLGWLPVELFAALVTEPQLAPFVIPDRFQLFGLLTGILSKRIVKGEESLTGI